MPGNKSKKIYILGSTGFLGSACVNYLKDKGHSVFTEKIDVTSLNLLRKKFQSVKPDVVINFAGVRAYPTIDWCEDHKEETVMVNVVGAINAMLAAIEAGAYPIQISSGCVYSGGIDRVFNEEDKPNFFGSFYSRMRIVLQEALAELPVLYARIRMPLSSMPHPRNFITKISSFDKVISIPNSITFVDDLWPALERLIKVKPRGILNLTNKGYVEHGKILGLYKRIINPRHTYKKISIKQLEGPGGITRTRRSNCVLSAEKAKSLGILMPPLDDKRLEEIMKKYKENLNKNK